MAGEFAQHAARGPASVGEVIGHLVEQALDAGRRALGAQAAEFGGSEVGSEFFHFCKKTGPSAHARFDKLSSRGSG
jgi:hypothetical protein